MPVSSEAAGIEYVSTSPPIVIMRKQKRKQQTTTNTQHQKRTEHTRTHTYTSDRFDITTCHRNWTIPRLTNSVFRWLVTWHAGHSTYAAIPTVNNNGANQLMVNLTRRSRTIGCMPHTPSPTHGRDHRRLPFGCYMRMHNGRQRLCLSPCPACSTWSQVLFTAYATVTDVAARAFLFGLRTSLYSTCARTS